MTLIVLVGVFAVVASTSGQRTSYIDYDYQDISHARQPAPTPRSAYASPVVSSPRLSTQSVQPRPTPVPILKQINRHNDDGSYTYGYEGADGSFKIETKLPTGEVMGKYGYVDDTGKLRVIDYGANRYGFQPAGEGITVAPPTLVDETTRDGKGTFADYDDEPVYAIPSRAQRPEKRPEIFSQTPQQTTARSYTGFEQGIRQSVTPSYEDIPIRYEATPAPVRFASPTRRPSSVRYTPQVQVARIPQQIPQHIPQQIPQQIPQHIPQQIPQQIPQHIPQQIPQQITQQVAHIPQQLTHIPQQAPQSAVPQRAAVPGAVPVFTPAPTPSPRPAPVREYTSPASGSLLDQLLKQYSLPAGVGQPLHDITFGSYSSQTNY